MGLRLSLLKPVWVVITWLLCVGCNAERRSMSASTIQSDDPPAVVQYRDVRGGKPPMRLYTVKLDLVNGHDRPMWFVMRYYGDKRLPTTDRFVAREGDVFSFGQTVLSIRERADVYHWREAKSFGVEMFGGEANFVACRLAGRGELHVDDCLIEAWGSIDRYEVWEVAEILVNDQVRLQDWIGSRMIAPEGHYATMTERNRDPRLAGEIKRGAKTEVGDEVKSVSMEGVRRWMVPINDIEKSGANSWK